MFHEIRLLYISNNKAAKDFAQYINDSILFPGDEDDFKYNSFSSENTLIFKQFESKIKQSSYWIFKPHDIRYKFTEFMFKYQPTEQNYNL